MKVRELIEKLEEMPQDAEIVMEFMDEIKSIRFHDFGGLTEKPVVQLNQYEDLTEETKAHIWKVIMNE